MLTPDQIQQLKSAAANGGSPTASTTGLTDDAQFHAWMSGAQQSVVSPSPQAPEPSYASRVGDDYTTAGKSITDTMGKNAAVQEGGGSGLTKLGSEISTGFNTAGDVAGAAFAPITEAPGVHQVLGGLAKTGGAISDQLMKIPGYAEFFNGLANHLDAHPEQAHAIGSAINLGMLGLGGEGEAPVVDAAKTAASTGVDLAKGAAGAVGDAAAAAPEAITSTVKNATEAINDKFGSGPKTAEEAAGQITQGKIGDLPHALHALGSIDTTGAKTYAELSDRLQQKIPELAQTVDAELSKDPTKYALSDLAKVDKTNAGAEVKTDYISMALEHLAELHNSTGDAVAEANAKELLARAQQEGLTRKEVNDISRQYGQEFGSKAFSKVTGDPLTSVNAQKFENVRSGLKDTARQGIGGDEAKAADRTLSSIYNTKDLVDKQAEAVNKLQQRIQQRGLGQKIGYAGMKIVDALTGGVIKGAVAAAIPRGLGLKTLNAIDLESNLARNLKILDKANSAPSDQEVIDAVKELAQPSSPSAQADTTAPKKSRPKTKPASSSI